MAALEKLNASYNIIKPVSPAFVHPLERAKQSHFYDWVFNGEKSIPLFKNSDRND